jgi:hypothetical protein
MKKSLLFLLACAIGLQAAEMKKLTFEQAFLNRGEALLKPLPEITGWLDDACYCESRDGRIFQVTARSGRSRVLLDPGSMKGKAPEKLDLLDPAD